MNNEIKNKQSIIPLIIYSIFMLIFFYIILIPNFSLNILNIIKITKDTSNYYILLSIITFIFLLYGIDIIKNGLVKLLKKESNIDTLLTIIIFFIYIINIIETVLYLNNLIKEPTIYLEVIALIIFIRKVVKYLNHKIDIKIFNNIKEVTRIFSLNIKVKGEEKVLSKEMIKEGDILLSTPGNRIIYDGKIVNGKAHFDESFISGRSTPIEKSESNKVLAGSINCDGTIEYTVENKDIAKYPNKKDTKSYINKNIKYIYIYIIIMFFLSITLNLILESNTPIYIIFINILIIICPYSLLIVDSIKKILITNNLLKKKIILKNVNAIEKINSIDTVVLDKTGVLTNGKFCVSKINNHSNMTDKELLSILGSIEKNSTHPIARGITSYLKDEKIKTNNDFLTEDLSGLGVKAKDDKDIYYACSSLLLKKLDIINSYQEEERKMLIDGNSVIYLVKNNKVIATFGIKDTLRKESINFVNSLKKKKLDIYILTGDNEVITNKIAQELNITNIYSGTTQEEKNNFVNKLLKENKKVLMIGDGENDILALNSATIGVTLKGVTDSVISASDIVLTSRNLLKILDLFTMGNKVSLFLKRAIYIYLIVSLFFIPIALELVPNVNLDFFLIIVYIILNIILLIINTIYIKKAK